MDYALFINIIQQFYRYNAVSVWIVDDHEIKFSTLEASLISDEALAFLKDFPKSKESVQSFNNIEYFISMPCPFFPNATLIAGSYCIHPINAGYHGKLALALLIRHNKLREYILSTPPIDRARLLDYVNLLARLSSNKPITEEMLGKSDHTLKRQLDHDLTEYVFTTAENQIFPYSPESERRILDMIKAGDVEGVRKINTSYFSDKAAFEIKYLYKIIALITLATRAAIEAGADTIDAYGLSDLYLDQLALVKTDTQISQIVKDVLPHFAELVNKRNEKITKDFSPHISKAEKYIKTNLHFPLSLKKVADSIGINEKYLSRLFIRCKGEKFSHYVNRQRINEAKELLIHTDFKLMDIAYSLAFVSESYFIKIFCEICGTTPLKFRNRYR